MVSYHTPLPDQPLQARTRRTLREWLEEAYAAARGRVEKQRVQRQDNHWGDYLKGLSTRTVTEIEAGEFIDRINHGQLDFSKHRIIGNERHLNSLPGYGEAHSRLAKLEPASPKTPSRSHLLLVYFEAPSIIVEDFPLHSARANYSSLSGATLVHPSIDYAIFRNADLRGASIEGPKRRTNFMDSHTDEYTVLEGKLDSVLIPRSWYRRLFGETPYGYVSGDLQQAPGHLEFHSDTGEHALYDTAEGGRVLIPRLHRAAQPSDNHQPKPAIPLRRRA